MKSRKKTAISAIIVVLCFIVALVFLLIRIRGDNEKALDEKLHGLAYCLGLPPAEGKDKAGCF